MGHVKDKLNECHIVVHGLKGTSGLCFTDSGEPAIFREATDAELFAANRRTEFPEVRYRVVDGEVL